MNSSERLKHIKDWEASGQTKKAYCDSHGIKYGTFISWFRGLKECADNGEFVSLPVSVCREEVCVEFPNGVRLYLSGSIDKDLLQLLYDV